MVVSCSMRSRSSALHDRHIALYVAWLMFGRCQAKMEQLTSAFQVMIHARAAAAALRPARSLSLFASAASALSSRGKKTGPVAKPSPTLCRAVVENGVMLRRLRPLSHRISPCAVGGPVQVDAEPKQRNQAPYREGK